MILRGILDRSLGSVTCIRGFAQIHDLERISKTNDYQRDIIPKHRNEIRDFLKSSEYKFFPEIVLSYTLSGNIDNAKLLNAVGQVLDLEKGKSKKPIVFSEEIINYKGSLDSNKSDKIRIVTIQISDELLIQQLKPFHRIDGNHRLSASVGVKDSSFSNMATPFCLLLLTDDFNSKKFESVVFHNLNSKGEHLTSEENLKAILNDEHFSDTELTRDFSWTFVKAREVVKKLDFTYLDGIKK